MFEGEGCMNRFALIYFESPVGKRFFHGFKVSLEIIWRYEWVIANRYNSFVVSVVCY